VAIGRSRGGPSTKIHALADALGNPANLRLTPGQDRDLAGAAALLENADPGALIGDESLVHGFPRAEPLGQITPRTARSIAVEHRFDEPAIVFDRPPT
jgi:hypothetical protein